MKWVTFLGLCGFLIAFGSAGASDTLKTEPAIEKNYKFWTQIYGHYPSHQGLVHDGKYIDHIYEIIELRPRGRRTHPNIVQIKRKWRSILLSVHQKQDHPEAMNREEKKVFELFRDVSEPNKFLSAAHRKRMRFQLGQSDRFSEGIVQAGKYLPLMEKLFAEAGLPPELTRLPFVESSFDLRARSKVGASGIWQFMGSTAKLFIRVDEAVDERNDPIMATLAAAKLFKLNYGSLKSWPLAVSAYNHGRKRLMSAVNQVGSDYFDQVYAEYRSRSFGFASRNFYAELLAAVEVEKNAEKYFGRIQRTKPLEYSEMQVSEPIQARELARQKGWNWKSFQELNPAFTPAVWSGELPVPTNYPIRY